MATKTVLDFEAITFALGTDIMYLIRGTGTTRDKQITLTEFFNTIPAATIQNGTFSLIDSDVIHGITALNLTTNTFGLVQINDASSGGLDITGVSDLAGISGFTMRGIIGVTDPTDTIPAISLIGGKADGAAGWQALGAAETVFQVSNYTTALMTVLGDGKFGIGIASSLGAGLDVEAALNINNIKAGATAPIYLSTNGTSQWINFNCYYNGTGFSYGKGSSSKYASQIIGVGSTGGIGFYTSPTAGNADATISDLTLRMLIDKNGHITLGTTAFSNTYVYFPKNNAATYPSITQALAVGANFSSGSSEIDLWNTNTAASESFRFYQQTGASAATLVLSLLTGGGLNIPSGGVMQHNGITLNGYITTGVTGFASDSPIRLKILEIGDWNMDTTATVSIAHELTYTKIIKVWAIIRDDIGTYRRDLISSSASATADQSIIIWDATDILLGRETGGIFDGAGHDSTSYNRGWIFIQYID